MTTPHTELPEFDYVRPATLAEACRFLADHAGQARVLLGGTDTLIRLRDGHWHDRYLVDVKHLPGMHRLAFDPATGLTVGAAVTLNQVIASAQVRSRFPLLIEAARSVASYPLRNRATLVGNLCNASPGGDTLGTGLVLEGVLDVTGLDGDRVEPLRSFFGGPGQTSLRAGDVVTAVRFPFPPARHAARYFKLGRNVAGDLALVGVTVLGFAHDDTPSGYEFRVALAAVAPVPLRVCRAEALLAQGPIDAAALDAAADAAMEACLPIDDVRASARYRRQMVRSLTRRALNDVWQQIERADLRPAPTLD